MIGPTPRLLAAAAFVAAACMRDDAAAPRLTEDAATGDVVAGLPPRSDAEALLATLDARPAERDSSVRAARAALAMDASWRATAALAPAMADDRRRTPSVVLLAATSAAERDDWTTVERLTASVPDSALAGFAPLLRARARLDGASGATAASRATMARGALDAARRSAALAADATERGVRLALAARALDRLAMIAEADSTKRGESRALGDSAAAAYRAAAAQLPPIADWLRLRAAEATRDAAARERAIGAVTLAPARARTAATDATARERAGDRAGAAVAYSALGRRVKALSLRLADADATSRASVRAAVRDSLVRIVGAQSGTAEARAAVELLDTTYGTLTPAEELAVARSAAASGPSSRAIAGYARALGAKLGTTRDHYTYATLLGRSGRADAAMAELARVRAAGGPLAGDAAYQRARLLVRGGGGATAQAALQDVVASFPNDTSAATNALYLLADLAIDAGHDADARALLLRLARQYPRSDRASRARFDAAIIAIAGGDPAAATRELDALRGAALDTAASDIRVAATYWAGRAAASTGDSARARTRWREVATRAPTSYYAVLAARRLGETAWRPAGGVTPNAAEDPMVSAAARRIALLQRIGFDPEVGWERDALTRWADSSTARLQTVAELLGDGGATSAAMRLARRALDRGAPPTTATYRLLYPWPWRSLMREAAGAQKMDPALAAAVVRQESNFTPAAVSPVGAVGLMQLMPPVGRSLWTGLGAASAGIAWSPALLRQPDVSVALGTRHLASSLARYADESWALAAYNAGQTPVARWSRRPGANDTELFVERIPYDETRDYVRIVTRNRAFYQALY